MDLNTILNIIIKYHLTGEELLLVYLTFIAQSENGNRRENRIYFDKWYEEGRGKERIQELYNSLKEKQVIIKSYNSKKYEPDEIEFNSVFIKRFFKLSGELGKELYVAYPNNTIINGRVVFLKNITKKFLNLSDFYFWYASTIGHSIEKHKKILEILEWAKNQNLIHCGIIEFVGSNQWIQFDELRKSGIQGRSETCDLYDLA